MDAIRVYTNVDNTLRVRLGYDASGSTFKSQVRTGKDVSTELLFAWTCTFETDGTDGVLLLTATKADLANLDKGKGWMDIVRVDGSNETAVCQPHLVKVEEGVTA